MVHHTIASARNRSLCSTTDAVLRHQHSDNNSQHSELGEIRLAAECVYVATVHPTSDIECPFGLH